MYALTVVGQCNLLLVTSKCRYLPKFIDDRSVLLVCGLYNLGVTNCSLMSHDNIPSDLHAFILYS